MKSWSVLDQTDFWVPLEPDSDLGIVKFFVEELFIVIYNFVALDLVKYSRSYEILNSAYS